MGTALRSLPRLLCIGVLAGEAVCAEPPASVEADRRRADYHVTMIADAIVATAKGTGGGLDRCRATGRVEAVHRRPAVEPAAAAVTPNRGARFSVDVWCWNGASADEPPGPARLHYGDATRTGRFQLWGSVHDGEFVVFQVETLR